MLRYLLLTITFFVATTLSSQEIDVPSVFVDCQANDCFEQYLKQEVTYLDYVFDRQAADVHIFCLLYTSPSPRDLSTSRMPSSA